MKSKKLINETIFERIDGFAIVRGGARVNSRFIARIFGFAAIIVCLLSLTSCDGVAGTWLEIEPEPVPQAAPDQADQQDQTIVQSKSDADDVEIYNLADIAVINAIIEHNGLVAPKAEGDGKSVPLNWSGIVTWSSDDVNKRIVELDLSDADLTGALVLSELESLETLDCHGNELKSLHLKGLTSLKNLYCYNSDLTSLYISKSDVLELIYCENNKLSELDISNLDMLNEINCSDNELTSLDVTGDSNLGTLLCVNNYFEDEDAIVGLQDTMFEEWGTKATVSTFMSDFKKSDEEAPVEQPVP